MGLWSNTYIQYFMLTLVGFSPPWDWWKSLTKNDYRIKTKFNFKFSWSYITKPDKWPINNTMEITDQGFSFSYNTTVWAALKTANSENPDKCTRAIGQYVQIWDGFIWLTPGHGHLSASAFSFWEQWNHSWLEFPNSIRMLEEIPNHQCNSVITLKSSNRFETDWGKKCKTYWVAPKGTYWLYGINLWLWLPPGWVGKCTIGYP